MAGDERAVRRHCWREGRGWGAARRGERVGEHCATAQRLLDEAGRVGSPSPTSLSVRSRRRCWMCAGYWPSSKRARRAPSAPPPPQGRSDLSGRNEEKLTAETLIALI